MGELVFLLLLGWLFASIGKKKSKAPKRKTLDAWKQMAESFIDNETIRNQAQPMQRAQPEKQSLKVEKAAKEPVQIDQHHEPLAEGESHAVQTAFQDTLEYVGSLHTTSMEGEDVCDPTLGHEDSLLPVELESVYAEQISSSSPLDFSSQGLYQGIVMSEILSRPAHRLRFGQYGKEQKENG